MQSPGVHRVVDRVEVRRFHSGGIFAEAGGWSAYQALQSMADQSPGVLQAKRVQEWASGQVMLKGKGNRSANGNDKSPGSELAVWKPMNGQEKIQAFAVDLWVNAATSDHDAARANYARTYAGTEGGWCDGWSHVLSLGGNELPTLWREIDAAIAGGESLSKTSESQAADFARLAVRYHILNGDPPTAGSAQAQDYQEAGYDLEALPQYSETWRHDYRDALPMHVIKAEIKSLSEGKTLRLTSPIHDSAVRRLRRNTYIVAETEEHGVQECSSLDQVMRILDEWRTSCKEAGNPFFSQSMVV